jgi:hypothetical protein
MDDRQRSSLDEAAARDVVAGTERVRAQARADQQGLAIPLLVLGPVTIVYAALVAVQRQWMFGDLAPGESRTATGAQLDFDNFLVRYWSTVGALALIAIGLWFWVRNHRVGAGAGATTWIAAGLGLYLLASYIGLLPWISMVMVVASPLAPTGLITLALLLVAWRRRNGRLALWAAAFGALTILAAIGFLNNRAYDLLALMGLPTDTVLSIGAHADVATFVVLGVLMVVNGWRALRRHRTASASPVSAT